MTKSHKGNFSLGAVVITTAASEALNESEINAAIERHSSGDWGDLPTQDMAMNDDSLINGGGLHSSYTSVNGIKFWIITDADRQATTILLPSDY